MKKTTQEWVRKAERCHQKCEIITVGIISRPARGERNRSWYLARKCLLERIAKSPKMGLSRHERKRKTLR
jgi:hypothetical protein